MISDHLKIKGLFEKLTRKNGRSLNTSCKLIMFITSCLFNSYVFAQAERKVTDPLDILQASPTASSMGTYGGMNVGMASGTVSKSIELYNFISGNLEVPI